VERPDRGSELSTPRARRSRAGHLIEKPHPTAADPPTLKRRGRPQKMEVPINTTADHARQTAVYFAISGRFRALLTPGATTLMARPNHGSSRASSRGSIVSKGRAARRCSAVARGAACADLVEEVETEPRHDMENEAPREKSLRRNPEECAHKNLSRQEETDPGPIKNMVPVSPSA
jgi:hypothetical protein